MRCGPSPTGWSPRAEAAARHDKRAVCGHGECGGVRCEYDSDMHFAIIMRSRSRRSTLLLLAATLAITAPLLVLASCFGCDHCGDECASGAPTSCVETCGGPVVTKTCGVCPAGLLPGLPLRCFAGCGGEIVFDGCGYAGDCPDGSTWEAETRDCVEQCGGPVKTICWSSLCPVGWFDSASCATPCEDFNLCVTSCSDTVTLGVRCGPCSEGNPNYIDWSSCPKGNADGGV